jgi:phosphoglycolate phosphatase-like HAD superfamily hydrolase
MQPKVIFFDFDGVLLDTIEAKGRAISKPFAKYGHDVETKVMQFHLDHGGMNREIKVKECFKLFLNKEVESQELSDFLKIINLEMSTQLKNCMPVQGALSFMKLHRCSNGLSWIVSAAPQGEIALLAQEFGYSSYVDGVYGYPHKKSEVIKMLIENQSLKREDCLMIGDAQEDLNAATLNGISFLLRRTSFSSFSSSYVGMSILDFTEAADAIGRL